MYVREFRILCFLVFRSGGLHHFRPMQIDQGARYSACPNNYQRMVLLRGLISFWHEFRRLRCCSSLAVRFLTMTDDSFATQ